MRAFTPARHTAYSCIGYVPSRGTIESVRKHAHAAASALTWGVSLVYAAAATFSVRAAA